MRKAEEMLLDLLARIHRDGGQKTMEVGLQESVRLADEWVISKLADDVTAVLA